MTQLLQYLWETFSRRSEIDSLPFFELRQELFTSLCTIKDLWQFTHPSTKVLKTVAPYHHNIINVIQGNSHKARNSRNKQTNQCNQQYMRKKREGGGGTIF